MLCRCAMTGWLPAWMMVACRDLSQMNKKESEREKEGERERFRADSKQPLALSLIDERCAVLNACTRTTNFENALRSSSIMANNRSLSFAHSLVA